MESEKIHSIESIPNKESDNSHKIHFESGEHPVGDGATEFSLRFRSNINAHAWNSAVAKRMRAYEPEVIAVDGSYPVSLLGKIGASRDYPVFEKQWIWAGIPANPSQLNGKGEVIVVAGDVSHMHLKYSAQEEVDKELMQALSEYVNTKQDERMEFERGEGLKETGVVTGLLLLANLALQYDRSKKHSPQRVISRRTFLKFTAGTALAGAILGKQSHKLASFAPNTTIENFAEQVMDIAKSRFTDETWVDGRTALLISKTKAALDQGLTPPSSSGSVVMGNMHGYMADDFLESSGKRRRAIKEYAQLLTEFVGDVTQQFPQISRRETQDTMLDMLATGDLLIARDPSDSNETPQQTIDRCVQYIGSFKSPEVLETIAGLRL